MSSNSLRPAFILLLCFDSSRPNSTSTKARSAIFTNELKKMEKEENKAALLADGEVDVKTVTYVTDTLPEALRFKEPDHDKLYPDFLDIDVEKKFPLRSVHSGEQAYRGFDRPAFKIRERRIDRKSPTAIELKDAFGDSRVFGWSSIEYPSGQEDPRSVKSTLKSYSQRPATAIYIKLSMEREVCFEIFANSLSRGRSEIGISFAAGTDPRVGVNLPEHTHIQELAAENELWRTDLELIPAGLEPSVGAIGRPHWSNITPDELLRLECSFDADMPLTESEELIVLLNRCNSLTLFRDWPNEWAEELDPFFTYMRTISYASAHLGNYWWYQLAIPGVGTASDDYLLSRAPIPRWMVTRWRVTLENGEPTRSKPIARASFENLADQVYPDAQTCAFELRLSMNGDLAARRNMLAKAATWREHDHGDQGGSGGNFFGRREPQGRGWRSNPDTWPTCPAGV